MNRETLIQRLHNSSDTLRDKLDYYLELDHEGYYDIADALADHVEALEGNNKAIPVEIKRIYLDAGYVQQVDISKVMVTSGKKYWFIMDGQHYDVVSSWEQWINN